jgi:5-methyltetrahydrofolate--homocysteine methyltransferase
VFLIAKANAGIPQWKNNELIYDATPPVMGRYAQRVRALGASFVGGCCGNTPAHVRAIADALSVPVSEEVLAELAAEAEAVAKATEGMAEEDGGRQRARRRARE